MTPKPSTVPVTDALASQDALTKAFSGPSAAGRETQTEFVYHRLLSSISAGVLKPGERLKIQAIADTLSLSITPVREALRLACRDGVVTERPYAGFVVSELSHEELWELFELRGLLEGFVVRKAIPKLEVVDLRELRENYDRMDEAFGRGDVDAFRTANTEFHGVLIRRGFPHGYTRDVIDAMSNNTQRYRAAARGLDDSYYRAAQADHLQLIEICERGDVQAAEQLVREHALTFARYLSQTMFGATRED
ncbi:MAG: GntR family transcriptional regulator [Jatrophihabitans sp.]|uniref:GntR family transcriptional regulator n=1 Tax=Jatrophihabitans sp. TaxID=1932789 RepID=UPI003F8090C6